MAWLYSYNWAMIYTALIASASSRDVSYASNMNAAISCVDVIQLLTVNKHVLKNWAASYGMEPCLLQKILFLTGARDERAFLPLRHFKNKIDRSRLTK